MSFLSSQQLNEMKFKYCGKNVKVSDKASIYNAQNIHLEDNCRIDDFCVLSAGVGGVHIGKYVHIAIYSSLIGAEEIYLDDFSGISARVSIYSSSDDFSGQYMPHPTIPDKYRDVDNRRVHCGKHSIVGAGSIILPGVKLNQGVAIGAMSLVRAGEYDEFTMFAGTPAKRIKERKRNLLKLEKNLLSELNA